MISVSLRQFFTAAFSDISGVVFFAVRVFNDLNQLVS